MEKAKGYWSNTIRVKESAAPIDNITKFAWYDEDYEEVELWHEYTVEELDEMARREQEQEFEEQSRFLDMANAIIDGVNEV